MYVGPLDLLMALFMLDERDKISNKLNPKSLEKGDANALGWECKRIVMIIKGIRDSAGTGE